MTDPSPRFLVVDASVSLKWALDDEEEVPKAIELRDFALAGHARMVAPSLWLYEVLNGVVVAVRRRRLAPSLGAEVVTALTSLGVELADPPAERTCEVALGHAVAAYDAAYLALAEELDTAVWTGDRRFYDAVRDTERVRWIGDWTAGR